MVQQIYQVVQPFATLFFYRQFTKKEYVKEWMSEDPHLTREQAEARFEEQLMRNEVPELDPMGPFRQISEDPNVVFEAAKRPVMKLVTLAWIGLVALFVWMAVVAINGNH